MAEDIYKEVNFKKYCETCEHKDLDEKFDPCCGCLDYGYNSETEKPVNWKGKKNNGRYNFS